MCKVLNKDYNIIPLTAAIQIIFWACSSINTEYVRTKCPGNFPIMVTTVKWIPKRGERHLEYWSVLKDLFLWVLIIYCIIISVRVNNTGSVGAGESMLCSASVDAEWRCVWGSHSHPHYFVHFFCKFPYSFLCFSVGMLML